jgi:hypothetical protein
MRVSSSSAALMIGASVVMLAANCRDAQADVIVLESNTDAYSDGDVLSDDAKLLVDDGYTIRVKMPDGSTKTITGFYSGTAAGYGGDNPGATDSGTSAPDMGATFGCGPACQHK